MSNITQIIRGDVLNKIEIIMRKVEDHMITETVLVSIDCAGISSTKTSCGA